MTILRVARAVMIAVTVVVLVVSGVYVIIDLARWEWNRAIVSGLIFLSTLVILSTVVLLRSIHRLGDRIGQQTSLAEPGVRDVLRASNAEAADRHFEWLERPPDGLAVFVPVLLGAGVLLSFVAYVIERIAGAVAGATLDRRTAAALVPDLPLTSQAVVVGPRSVAGPAERRPVKWVGWLVGGLFAVVLAVGAVEGIRQLTQSRPDSIGRPGTSRIELQIGQKRTIRPAGVVAEELWVACRNRLPGLPTLTKLTVLGPDRVEVEIDRALGTIGRNRIVGCFEDLTIDLVLADVTSIEIVPDVG